MKSLLLLVLPLCLLAACGGGDNERANTAALLKYEPDYSNPVGATDAFARAIEDQDIALMEEVMVPEEREAKMPMYRKNFESTLEANGDWRLEFEQGYYIDENHTVTRTTYIQIENGEEKDRKQNWTVFKKIDDGTWRFSPAESRKYTDEYDRLRENPPGNEPPPNAD